MRKQFLLYGFGLSRAFAEELGAKWGESGQRLRLEIAHRRQTRWWYDRRDHYPLRILLDFDERKSLNNVRRSPAFPWDGPPWDDYICDNVPANQRFAQGERVLAKADPDDVPATIVGLDATGEWIVRFDDWRVAVLEGKSVWSPCEHKLTLHDFGDEGPSADTEPWGLGDLKLSVKVTPEVRVDPWEGIDGVTRVEDKNYEVTPWDKIDWVKEEDHAVHPDPPILETNNQLDPLARVFERISDILSTPFRRRNNRP